MDLGEINCKYVEWINLAQIVVAGFCEHEDELLAPFTLKLLFSVFLWMCRK
jgi:hypothetical protein